MNKPNNQDRTFINQALACLDKTNEASYPLGFTVSEWWTNEQRKFIDKIRNLSSCKEVIEYAQQDECGFDHRIASAATINCYGEDISRDSIITERLEMLKSAFPDSWESVGKIGDSILSIESSISICDGVRYSNIYLTHLYFYLNIKSMLGKINQDSEPKKRILEIGGGYGGLARIFSLADENIQYFITDLPESLCFCYVYLKATLPEARVAYLPSSNPDELDSANIILVPVNFANAISGFTFATVINTGSFQEMTTDGLLYWMKFIQEKINALSLYSWNYFLNDLFIHSSVDKANDMNLFRPTLDQHWNLVQFRLNPCEINQDVKSRNWLELFATRIPTKDRVNEEVYYEEASRYFHSSLSEKIASNDWFAKVWLALLKHPNCKRYISALLEGIDQFKRGKGNQNNKYWDIKPLDLYGDSKFSSYHDDKIKYPLYSEERYLKKLL